MVYILHIETATKNCSVSIAKNGEIIALKEQATESFSHAEKLHLYIETVLKQAQLQLSNLQAIAVSQGPGSYTGLRIGVSAAKGLCYALNIPLIAVDTLAILAEQIAIKNGLIVPMLDARRMEVYSAFFNAKHQKTRTTKAEIISAESYSEINETMHLLGDGASKLTSILTADKFKFYPEILYPSAKDMASIAYNKFKKSDTVDVAYFEPFYLKDFILNR